MDKKPIFVFTEDDVLKIIANFCANNIDSKFKAKNFSFDINYNDSDEIEVFLVDTKKMN